jgi:hypothetical protein
VGVLSFLTPALRVEWERLNNPKLYEDMVSVALSYEHPLSTRIDGSGGDGGRDVHFPGEEGLEIFELKSFTGRVQGNRRTQVKNSFMNAMRHDPKRWFLVVPIDPTPGEEKWFKELTQDSSAQCHWIGKTGLDALISRYPKVSRYFLTSVNDEVVELLERLNAEQSALANGVPDAIARVRAIAEQLEDVDPYYFVNFVFDSLTGQYSTFFQPRYPGAEKDRPVEINVRLSFSNDEHGQEAFAAFKEHLDFGVQVILGEEFVQLVSINAPAGLGGEFSGGVLQISPDISNVQNLGPLLLRITAPDGKLLSSLPMESKAVTGGARGFTLDIVHKTGSYSAHLILDSVEPSVSVCSVIERTESWPIDLLPVYRFLAVMTAPNRLNLALVTGQEMFGPLDIGRETPMVEASTLEVTELLAKVQEAAGIRFVMPDLITAEEFVALATADELFEGREVEGTWAGQIVGAPTAVLAREALGDTGMFEGDPTRAVKLIRQDDETFIVAGNSIHLGRVTSIFHSARLVDPEGVAEVLGTAGNDEVVAMAFEPAKVNTVAMWLGGPEDRPTDQTASELK